MFVLGRAVFSSAPCRKGYTSGTLLITCGVFQGTGRAAIFARSLALGDLPASLNPSASCRRF